MSGPQVQPSITPTATVEEWRSFWIACASRHELQFQELLRRASKGDVNGLCALNNFLEKQGCCPRLVDPDACKVALQALRLANKAPQHQTVSAILQAASADDHGIDYNREAHIQNILVDVDGTKTRAYFIASENVSFRHQGDRKKKPSLVFLRNLQEYEDHALVYYSSSGSGKTVELAGSSATRNADITFILQGVTEANISKERHSEYNEQAEEQWNREIQNGHHKNTSDALYTGEDGKKEDETKQEAFKERIVKRNVAMDVLLPEIEKLLNETKSVMGDILVAAIKEKRQLRIVLAVDEGSNCPLTLRGLLRSPDLANTIFHEALSRCEITDRLQECAPLESQKYLHVNVSIAGTGVSSSTIGSIAPSFKILQPNFEVSGKEKVCSWAFQQNAASVSVPWSTKPQTIRNLDMVGKYLPVVAALMENGRMASIAIAEIAAYKQDEAVYESKLVDKIVLKFMKANGLAPLVDGKNSQSRQAVASAALAVSLFGELKQFRLNVPKDADKITSFANKMDFFPLEYTDMRYVDIKTIVATFGLLEPTDEIGFDALGKSIFPPLKMNPAQQLVAAHMLGIDLNEMLEPSWIGFEVLATHSVKCAIAASMSVADSKRPDLRETLSRIGFQLDNKATSESISHQWSWMQKHRAISILPNTGQSPTVFHSETRQLRVQLKTHKDDETLQIDKVLHETLYGWGDDKIKTKIFAPPVACINYGNSNFPDGFVTFFAKDQESRQKMTIMIQAKDYHSGAINSSDLNKHSETANSTLLDGVFGKNRLLCVASSSESLAARRKTNISRDFLPFHVQKSYLFSSLLEKLKDQRSEAMRVATYAIFCDKDGVEKRENSEGALQRESKRPRVN